jgi:hypothetical protein
VLRPVDGDEVRGIADDRIGVGDEPVELRRRLDQAMRSRRPFRSISSGRPVSSTSSSNR